MQKLLKLIVSMGFLSISSCGAEEVKSTPNIIDVCVYEPELNVPALELLHMTAENGGRTCYFEGKKMVFIPSNNSKCDAIENLSLKSMLSVSEATDWFSACSAVSRNSISGERSIYFTYNGNKNVKESDFVDFGMDLKALVTNDALEVSHFGQYGNIICMESSDPYKVQRHINDSGVFVPETATIHFDERGCAEVSLNVQGLTWPNFNIGH